ncbi:MULTISPECIES: alpha/beta hydrolase [unclassified Brevibacillus]|uniref:alpha/beta hydrolase n=1 Tax=unclassified Brevibacillus TaxID=2684853 RepID=UPI0035636FA3
MKFGFRYFSYISEELPIICKSVFNISSEREDTIIIGDSMGGYGALKCALSKPERYGYCCAFSSPCLFLKEDLDEHEILDLANKIKDQSVRPDIYNACGTEDFMRDINVRFYNEMRNLNFTIEYEEWSGNHDWYFFNEALQKALKKVLK